ncbi:hypothetical protein TcCL_ESM08447 [Trypanosoma cruzi]|nr:hypothetical protein TcCL_ESM08447 [Trypanosoma cruzi]
MCCLGGHGCAAHHGHSLLTAPTVLLIAVFATRFFFARVLSRVFSCFAMTVWKGIRLSPLSLLMSCCTGLYFHGVVCEELNARFVQWKRDPTSRLLLVVNCSSTLPWIYMRGAIQFAGARRWRSSSMDPCFQERL